MGRGRDRENGGLGDRETRRRGGKGTRRFCLPVSPFLCFPFSLSPLLPVPPSFGLLFSQQPFQGHGRQGRMLREFDEWSDLGRQINKDAVTEVGGWRQMYLEFRFCERYECDL